MSVVYGCLGGWYYCGVGVFVCIYDVVCGIVYVGCCWCGDGMVCWVVRVSLLGVGLYVC